MALGDGDTWDETNPTDSTIAVQIDDYMRDIKKGVRSRLEREHEFPASQSSTSQAGAHKFITLQAQSVKPTLSGTQVGAVYVTTDSPSALYFENSAGTLTNISTPIPSGGIIMYSGSVSAATALAPVWYVCNGSNSTPNLQDRFIVCAGSTYAVAAAGGAATHVLTVAELPAHTHPLSGVLANSPNNSIVSQGNAYDNGLATVTGSTGSGDAHNNLPPYYALAFIMKA